MGTWGLGSGGLRAGEAGGQGHLWPPDPLGPERARHRLGDLWAPQARAGGSWWPERPGTVGPGAGAASSAFEARGDPSESPAPTLLSQDCLRACQEQIEALLESSLRQAQQQNLDPKAAEEEEAEEEADLACTPTDVRDVNI